MFMKAKPRLSYCFCKVKCAKSQHFSFAGGFAGTPSLAVGLFYTCILQGARQVQGPCCTNPSAYAIHARQKWIMNASCGYSFFLKFIFLHSFCNRNRKSLNWKGQKWNFKVKNVLLAVLALLNHPWIRKAKRESCK